MHYLFIAVDVLAERCLKGLPFLRNQLIGDSVFVALIFGGHRLATRTLKGRHVTA